VAIAVRAVLPETGDRAIDQSGVLRHERGGVEAVAGEVADLEVLHQHVALERERPGELAAARARDIQRDRFLAAIAGDVVGGVARLRPAAVADEGRSPAARIVALARALDLDHLGAQVRQVLRSPRAGEHAGEV